MWQAWVSQNVDIVNNFRTDPWPAPSPRKTLPDEGVFVYLRFGAMLGQFDIRQTGVCVTDLSHTALPAYKTDSTENARQQGLGKLPWLATHH